MSFQPIPYLDCHICEIEVLATESVSSISTPLNLGNILVDTGGQISITSNYINFPANMEFFVKANLICQAPNGGVTSTGCNPTFYDASNNVLDYQAIGLGLARTGANSGVWFASVDCFMMLFSSVSQRSARISIANVSTTYPITVPYNSATNYIPNSSITILYK
jgi:hypothetical protein